MRIFSHIAPLRLNGVHDAGIRMGDLVVVFGSVCRDRSSRRRRVLRVAASWVVDPVKERRDVALKLGGIACSTHGGSVAERISPRRAAAAPTYASKFQVRASARRGDPGRGLFGEGRRDGLLPGRSARAVAGRGVPP